MSTHKYIGNNMNDMNDVLAVVLTSAHWLMAAHWPVDHCTNREHKIMVISLEQFPHMVGTYAM